MVSAERLFTEVNGHLSSKYLGQPDCMLEYTSSKIVNMWVSLMNSLNISIKFIRVAMVVQKSIAKQYLILQCS